MFKRQLIELNQDVAPQGASESQKEGQNRWQVKLDQEVEEEKLRRRLDDQTQFGGGRQRNLIEEQNQIQVEEILEEKARLQLENLCANWETNIIENISPTLPPALLSLFKLAGILTLVDIIWVAFSCLFMPTAGMHFFENQVTSNIRWHLAIFWSSNYLQWIGLITMFSNLTHSSCRTAIILTVVCIVWHIANLVFYFSFQSSRASKFSITNAVYFWLESLISLILLFVLIILYLRIDQLFKATPSSSSIIPLAQISQYPLRQTNWPNSQQNQPQYSEVQSYNPNKMKNPITLNGEDQNPMKLTARQGLRQPNTALSKTNLSILNETETNALNNMFNIPPQSQRIGDVVVDEIQDNRTAVISVYQADWRTHYGEYAPDLKKRKIIASNMIPLLEEDLKQSKKMKIAGSRPVQHQYSYFDLHFNKIAASSEKQQLSRNINETSHFKLPVNDITNSNNTTQNQGFQNQFEGINIQKENSRSRPPQKIELEAFSNNGGQLGIYGEKSHGVNPRNQVIQDSVGVKGFEDDTASLHSGASMGLSNPSNSSKQERKEIYFKQKQERESEYFKAKAEVQNDQIEKKQRWGKSSIVAPLKLKTFDIDINQAFQQ